MIYFEDLAMIEKYGNDVILRHCKALDDWYYRIDSQKKYYEDCSSNSNFIDATMCSAETLEETLIWCDLHGLNILEMIEED